MALNCSVDKRIYTLNGNDYSYGEFLALLYDGLLERIPELTARAGTLAQEELDSIAEEAVELEDTGMVSLGEQAAEKVAESLASIGVTVEVLDNAEYLADARIPQEIRQRSQGVFVTDSGTVLLNRQRIQSQYGDVVAYHEGVHPILNIIRNTDKARYDALVMGIREEAKTNEALKQLIERVSNNPAYKGKGDIVLGDEILSETIGMIGSGEIQVKVLSRNLLQKIVDFFNSIAVALKLKKMSPQMAQREFAKTANDIANALKYGRSVVPIVGKKGIGLFQSATGKTMIYERAVDPAEVRARVVAGKPISTRNPTGKAKDIEGTEPDGTADLAAMRKDPKLYRTNAILMAEYPIVAANVPEVARYIRQLRKPLMDLQSLFDKTSTTLADLRDTVKSELIAQEKKEAQKAGKPLKGFKTKATTADVDLILEGAEVPYVITPKIQRLIDKIRPLQEKMKDLKERRKKALSDYKKVLESPAAVKKFGQKEADKVYEALIDGFKRNLQKLIDLFPKDLLDAASLWYDGANIIAQQFSKDYNTTLERASAVLAVFSPQKDWFMNVALAKRMMNVWVNHQDTVFDEAMEKRFLKRAGEPEPKTNKEGDVVVGEDGEIEYTKGAKPVFDEDGNLTGWIGWDNASYKEKYEEGLRILEQMRGKKLKDLPTHLQARFIRMWSEVYDKPGFEIVSPDGNFGTNKLSDKGNEVKLAWGSYVTIEKAIRIMQASEANEMSVISDELGEQHKVRSFYNNIVDPANKGGHVTMDTHAIAAGLWMALSGGSLEVAQNFGGGGASSNINIGVKGTYAVNGEAYRRLSDELRAKGFDYLARQIQSITWEGVRLLFPAKFKSNYQNVAKVRAVWEQFQRREITIDQAHDRIYQIVDEWRNRATLKGRPGKTASDAIADGTGLGVRPDWASFTGSGADYTGGAQQADDAGRLPSVGRAGGTGLGRGAGGRGDVGQPSGVVSRPAEGQEQGPVLDVQPSMIERPSKGMLAPGEWNSMVMPIRESLKANKDVDAIMQDLASQGLTEGFDQQKLDALRDRVTASHAKFNQLRGGRAGAKPAGAAVPFRKTEKQREVEEEVQAGKPVKKVEVDEMKALKDQIRLEAKAAAGAARDVAQKRKQFAAKVNSIARGLVSGLLGASIRPKSLATIATLAASVDPTNEAKVEEFLEKLDDIIGKAERNKYDSERRQEAFGLRRAIRRGVRGDAAKKRDYSFNLLAKDFASLSIPEPKDIDAYLEIARAVKDIVDGVKVRITPELVEALKTDAGLNNESLRDYIDRRQKAEKREAKEKMLREIEEIRIEAGLEDVDLTEEDIEAIMAEMKAEEDAKSRIQAMVNKRQKLNMLKTMSRIKLQELKALRGTRAFGKEDADIVDGMLKIDPEHLNFSSAVFLIGAVNNIVVNGTFGGARALAAKGIKDEAIAEMQKLMSKSKGWGSPGMQWRFNRDLDQIAVLFEKLARSPKAAAELRRLTGFDGMMDALSEANKIVQKTQDERSDYAKKVGYKDNLLNRYKMGVYAYVIQNSGITDEEIALEFKERVEDIMDSAKLLSNERNYKQDAVHGVLNPDLYRRAVSEVLGDAKAIEDVRIETPLKKMVEWEIKKNEEFVELHERSADRDHNKGFNRWKNYTGTAQISVTSKSEKADVAGGDKIDLALSQSPFFPTSLRERPAASKKERKGRREGQVTNINFFNVQDESRKEGLADSLGSRHVAVLREVLSDSRFTGEERLIDESTRELLLLNAKSILGIDAIRNDLFDKRLAKVYYGLIRRSGGLALKGLLQFPKQATPLVSTWVALNPLNKGGKYLAAGLGDATRSFTEGTWQHELIKGRQIGQRSKIMGGLNAIGDEIAREPILRGDEGRIIELLKVGAAKWSAGANELGKTISTPDAFTATASWFAFYRQHLENAGIDTDSEGWKHEPNEKAASYANQMVERAQNANTPEAMPAFYKSRSIYARALQGIVYAFSSFSLNSRKRFNRNMSMIFTGTKDEKAFALADTAGLFAETAAFAATAHAAYAIGSGLAGTIMSALFGDDEEEEKKKKKKERSAWEKIWSRAVFDFLFVGLPDFVLDYPKEMANRILKEKGVEDLFYVSSKTRYGTIGPLVDELTRASKIAEGLVTGEIGEKKLTDNQKDMLKLSAVLTFFSLTGISLQETNKLNRELMGQMPMSRDTWYDSMLDFMFGDEQDEKGSKRGSIYSRSKIRSSN